MLLHGISKRTKKNSDNYILLLRGFNSFNEIYYLHSILHTAFSTKTFTKWFIKRFTTWCVFICILNIEIVFFYYT